MVSENDDWFCVANVLLKSLDELITIYHDTVGNNGVLEMDFAIDTTGNVHPNQAAQYKALGDTIRNCYSTPIASTNAILNGTANTTLQLSLPLHTYDVLDRVIVQEDIQYGQRVRHFSIEVDGQGVANWTSVGHKKILLFEKVFTDVTSVALVIDQFVGDAVFISNFAAFKPCANVNL
ncbi:hypothetical protein RFI_06405 [Reticulomyxa filosa]|uniref:Uncharacterized protein n=1 Tax=Reticulomyxa filosa TaxID=46433 RepID=X6NWL8_RETFI|nr:hypothetical protein RFI_06405 [Reticulomyxa filosa]|eukprot:ETO30715.1 hypothetical protein RFI_06405 [Reticulomyxa filosa]